MSLTEMLISLAISMVVISGVVSIYASTIGSSSATLKASKLNQELTAVLSVMVNDIRRAGYDGDPDYNNPQNNPFSQIDNSALEVHDASGQVASNATVGNCIVYTYDADDDGFMDNTDIMGFRVASGAILMRRQGNTTANPNDHDNCTDADDTWLTVTDNTLINITSLAIDLAGSECLNTSEPNGVDNDGDAANAIDNAEEYDCIATTPAAGDVTVETRQVAITIAGALVNDDNNNPTTASVSQTVRVRNDLVRVR